MFGSSQDEDHLYEFNTNIDTSIGSIPGTAGGYGSRAPLAAFRSPGTAQQRPMMSQMGNRAAPMSRGGVPGTAARIGTASGGTSGEARPMTSVSGAGYHGSSKDQSRSFDPLNIARGPAPALAEKADNSSEDKAKEMEKNVHRLVESSADAVASKNMQLALEKAKEAGKAERALCKFRESHGLAEQINLDLTYAICFNLANAYYHNKLYDDAINTYQLIVRNKQYPQSGRLRVNIGNIYFEQKKYPQAIKMYRMALDQIPSTGKELRFRIIRNIGNAFIKLGQFQDAIDSFDSIMTGSADTHTAFNLLLCLYARGDKEKIKHHFSKMLTIPISGMTEEEEEKVSDPSADISMDIERPDHLKEELRKRRELAEERILTASRLIAPMVDEKADWAMGYKWVMEQMRSDYETVASKLEVDMSMAYMSNKKFDDAIELLKGFERKGASMKAMASTNLSFIYFLEGEYTQAEKYADVAIRFDRYNAKALVNKGNCFFMAGEFGRAKEMYLEAVGVEADCVEAIFNLGLTNVKLNAMQEAHHAFEKMLTILPSTPEAMFNLGLIYERTTERSELEQAAKTYEMLLNKMPGDPNLCSRIAQVYEKLDDENTACHWQTEAHRHFPVNLNVISWLGVWYVKREMYEQAIEYFARAALVQPSEVKWRLMVASCYRRLGDFHRSFDLYEKIHEEYPDNIESLQYLEALCRDLGKPYDVYTKKLEKLRRMLPAQTQAGTTRAGATSQPQAQQVPQRSDRPRPERPSSLQTQQFTDATQLGSNSSGNSPVHAPRAGGTQQSLGPRGVGVGRPSARAGDDEDDFADTDVTSLLG